MVSGLRVVAAPREWPLSGPVAPERVAFLIVDMQVDFLNDTGWLANIGFDVAALQGIVPVIAGLLEAARDAGLHIVHTRQGNAADLSDLPPVRMRQRRIRTESTAGVGLVRGSDGWQFVAEVAPRPGELVIDKLGFSVFAGTDLTTRLAEFEVEALVITGVTTNVCVLATLLDAVDRGFDCLVVTDAIAAPSAATTEAVLEILRAEDGLFGAMAPARALQLTLRSAAAGVRANTKTG